MTTKQLTLMPILDGSVFVNDEVINDPVLLSVLTDLHDRKFQFPSQEVERWYFDTVKGLSRSPDDILKAIQYLEYRRLRRSIHTARR